MHNLFSTYIHTLNSQIDHKILQLQVWHGSPSRLEETNSLPDSSVNCESAILKVNRLGTGSTIE